jgi:hypothetical protein
MGRDSKIIMSDWLGVINYGVIVANDMDTYVRSNRYQNEAI